LYDPDGAKLVRPGNIEDDFDKLADVDWIIEAVFEKLEIKRSLFERLESVHRKGQVVSSSTSGISLREITKGRSKKFLSHVLITQFFNPPRYMHLMELVAGEDTDEELLKAITDFSERVLGKGVVVAKDTSNFIGNRIGFFDENYAFRLCQELKLSVEEADTIAGPLMGRPKSGLFRLLDIIGMDITVNINSNLYEAAVDDEQREVFKVSPLLTKMMEKGLLGEKAGGGFYRKSKDADGNRVIESLDLDTLEYSPCGRPDFEILKTAKKESDFSKRLKMLLGSDDVVGQFAWGLLSNTLCYAANRIPEISDDTISIDNAMKWGYNWEKGPFELWDAIGVRYIATRLEKEYRPVPKLVTSLLKSGSESFYGFKKERVVSFDPKSKSFKPTPQRARVTILEDLKKAKMIVKRGEMASIIDLGDGIICLECHSMANTITTEVIELIQTAVQEVEKNFQGLVIGNQGTNFCLGADLKEMAGYAQSGRFDAVDKFINSLQSTLLTLKYCHAPTVAAVHGMVLDGGCELAMQCDSIQAAPETYIGLVESGIGLIAAGGGCKEWAIRCSDWLDGFKSLSAFAKMNKIVEMIGTAKTSSSGADARKMGYLRACDGITMNRDSIIYSAKQLALQLSEQGYQPPLRNNNIRVMGRGGVAEFKVRSNMWKQGNFISEYDEFVLNKLVHVLCGGDVPDNSEVSEQYLLDLEREAFVSLIGQKKTLERIEYTLKTGKPLKN
jgi:3-hydroxyacyl-CoA dehydrogenase